MREINKIAEGLFEKIRDRFEDVSLGDDKAKATQDPEKARFFNFDYTVDDENLGNVTLSIIDETSLKVYFSKNISDDLTDEQRHDWYGFLKELRRFAKSNLLSFEPRDITRSTLKHRDLQQVSKADSTYDKDEVISESLYGTRKSSYERKGPVRLIVRHTKALDEIENRRARTHNINSIYLETQEGERFKLPVKSLRLGRALAQHVKHGGSMHDDLGQHICEMAEECAKLKPFINNTRNRTFEDTETQSMAEAAVEYHGLLNNTLKRMTGKKGYQRCKEQFVATSTSYIPEIDTEEMKQRFEKRTFDDRLEEALPLVHKAYNMKKENKFAEQFVNWADTIAEGTWAVPNTDDDVDKLIELLSNPLPAGVDGQNATNALYNLIGDDKLFDKIQEIARIDPEHDVGDLVADWLQEHLPNIYQQIENEIGDPDYPAEQDIESSDIDEGNTYGSSNSGIDGVVYEEDNQEDQLANIEDIQSAIIRRILNSIDDHSELLKKAGPEGIMNAASDVASFHAPMEEIGSSDVSIMVREVYREVGVDYPEEVNEDKEECKYCGGDCPNDEEHACDGYLGDIDDLYKVTEERDIDDNEEVCTYCGEPRDDKFSCCDENHWETKKEFDDNMNEAKDTIKYDPKTGKLTGWEHEGDWEKTKGKKKDPIGKIHNLSDKARRETEKMSKDETLEEAFDRLVNEDDTFTEDQVSDKLQSFIGQTFYVPAEGQKGTVAKVAEKTRFSNSLVVDLANGTTIAVHFKDLKPVEETPGPIKQLWQRLVATITGGATPKMQPKYSTQVPDPMTDIKNLAGLK